ncbi:glutathione S-transferase family protein [Roseomonas sp. CCTCC AB2023176]|uniref:glutathione S-transferase family protein n=1 Tax=Roseomonas sp. CCTCC AB2023176 TaxID=3342640 RepID=UPI0035D58062
MSVLTIYGRANSSNVMKVLWACHELDVPFTRVDAGGAFGRTKDPDMLAKNPMALVPTVETEDGFTLWESHAILHFLANGSPHAARVLPADPKRRAKMHQWMDWVLSALGPTMTPVFFGHVRIPPEKRDHAAIRASTIEAGRLWGMLDAELSDGRDYACGEFSLADIAFGPHLHRWIMLPVDPNPDLPRLVAYHARLRARAGFAAHLDHPIT